MLAMVKRNYCFSPTWKILQYEVIPTQLDQWICCPLTKHIYSIAQ